MAEILARRAHIRARLKELYTAIRSESDHVKCKAPTEEAQRLSREFRGRKIPSDP